MTWHEHVMEVLREDPDRIFTTSEIALEIWPEAKGDKLNTCRGRVSRVLASAARFGMVEKIQVTSNLQGWRLAR